MVKIDSPEALRAWLKGKPRALEVVIASRAAMRALPVAMPRPAVLDRAESKRLTLALFRASAISRLGAIYPGLETPADYRAAQAVHKAVQSARYARKNRRVGELALASTALTVSYHTNDFVDVVAESLLVFGIAARQPISDDCQLWEEQADLAQLLSAPLWPHGLPTAIANDWNSFASTDGLGPEWSEWTRWYQRRLDGSASEWGLSPKSDAAMAKRLIEADEAFWLGGEKDPAWVNAQLADWLAELRAEDEANAASTHPPLEGLDQTTARLASPRVVLTAGNTMAVVANPLVDSAKDPRSFAELVNEMLVLLPATYSLLGRNTPKIIKSNLRFYKSELKQNRKGASWGALDRLMSNAQASFAACEAEMFDLHMAEQIKQVFALHASLIAALRQPQELHESIDSIKVDTPGAAPAVEEATRQMAGGLQMLKEHQLADGTLANHLTIIINNGGENAISLAQGSGLSEPRKASARRWIFGALGLCVQIVSLLGSMASIAPFVLDKEQLDAVMAYFQSAVAALRSQF